MSGQSAEFAEAGLEGRAARAGVLELRERGGRSKHWLLERTVNGGDPLELCCSGGWIIGRYEWAGDDAAPRFHFSVELAGGGRVWESSFELPEGALLRWPGR